MTNLPSPPTDDELDEFEELARLCRPGTTMAAQWGEDLADAVARLVVEVRRLRNIDDAVPATDVEADESRRIHEEATRLLAAAKTAQPVAVKAVSPYQERTATDEAWQRGLARAAAWSVIVVIVLGFVVAFPSLLVVLVVGGLLWWAIRVLVRTSRPRRDGKA